MQNNNIIEIPVRGMDCAECATHVQRAIANLPGVRSVDVFLASEKAVISADTAQLSLPMIHKAVMDAGYSVPEEESSIAASGSAFTHSVMKLFGIVFGMVLLIVVAGELLSQCSKDGQQDKMLCHEQTNRFHTNRRPAW